MRALASKRVGSDAAWLPEAFPGCGQEGEIRSDLLIQWLYIYQSFHEVQSRYLVTLPSTDGPKRSHQNGRAPTAFKSDKQRFTLRGPVTQQARRATKRAPHISNNVQIHEVKALEVDYHDNLSKYMKGTNQPILPSIIDNAIFHAGCWSGDVVGRTT